MSTMTKKTSFQLADGIEEMLGDLSNIHSMRLLCNAALLMFAEAEEPLQKLYLKRIGRHDQTNEPITPMSVQDRLDILEAEGEAIARAYEAIQGRQTSKRRRDGGKAG